MPILLSLSRLAQQGTATLPLSTTTISPNPAARLSTKSSAMAFQTEDRCRKEISSTVCPLHRVIYNHYSSYLCTRVMPEGIFPPYWLFLTRQVSDVTLFWREGIFFHHDWLSFSAHLVSHYFIKTIYFCKPPKCAFSDILCKHQSFFSIVILSVKPNPESCHAMFGCREMFY